jgi:hypothetical protein
MRGIPEYGNDRYAYQLGRQAKGLTCSDCGSSMGHFSYCPLLHNEWAMRPKDEVSMEQVLGYPGRLTQPGKPQPDSQSFYRKAQELRLKAEAIKADVVLPEDYQPVYTQTDHIHAHALGVSLDVKDHRVSW